MPAIHAPITADCPVISYDDPRADERLADVEFYVAPFVIGAVTVEPMLRRPQAN